MFHKQNPHQLLCLLQKIIVHLPRQVSMSANHASLELCLGCNTLFHVISLHWSHKPVCLSIHEEVATHHEQQQSGQEQPTRLNKLSDDDKSSSKSSSFGSQTRASPTNLDKFGTNSQHSRCTSWLAGVPQVMYVDFISRFESSFNSKNGSVHHN